MNIIFDFGNVLVRWEPELVFVPYFGGDKSKFDYFWEHICDADFRNRIDAGEPQMAVIQEYQQKHPDYAEAIAMYFTRWEESLPGEMPGMHNLVKQLKSDPENHIYGLTNWSMETFPKARKRFEILQQIEDYVVSGDVKMVKPDPRIFHLLLDKYQLKPEDCYFVDDNASNVASACNLGLRGIVFNGAEDLFQQLTKRESTH